MVIKDAEEVPMEIISMIIASLRDWFKFLSRVALPLTAGLIITSLIACGGPAPSPSPTATPSPSTPSPSPSAPPLTTTPPPSPSPTPASYSLSITVSPQDGGGVSPSSGTYNSGTQVTLKATTASACWAFDHWGGDVSGNITTMPLTINSNKNVTAYFVKVKYALSVTVTPLGSGNVGPTGGTYNCGEAVTLVATPAAGFQFDHWAGDASGNSASTNITMQSDKNITAYFRTLYQTIKRDMPAGSMALNTGSYTNQLKAGQRIQGFVELTGEYQAGDVIASWNFVITGPQGIMIENWEGNALSSQHHDFDKTVQFDGIYTIKVSHNSRWPKTITIQIMPGGWG